MKWKSNDSANIPPADVEIEVETDGGEQYKAILEEGNAFRIVETGRWIMDGIAKWRKIKK